ncbi:MAG: HD domain-containing phosphohydrolase [Candidatus Hydrogenedentales bacterium]|jgi:putative nucleotidyltransferase with HDIG domain
MADYDQLILLSGENKGTVVTVNGTVTVGRHPGNTIQFNDLQVSRRHAEIYRNKKGIFIKDLDSGNGIYVNQERIKKHELQDSEIIQIGRQQLQYRYMPPEDEGSEFNGLGFVERDLTESRIDAQKTDDIYRTFFQVAEKTTSEKDVKEIEQRLKAVYTANQAISSERSLKKVFDTIMDQIFILVPAHNGLILLAKDDQEELSTEYLRTTNPTTKIQVSTSIVNRCFKNDESVITSNAPQDNRFEAGMSIISGNISSAMCAPLSHQGECLGVLYVGNHGLNDAFTNNDLELLVALAGPAATAIKNAQYLAMVEQTYHDTLSALANAIELRDHYTVGHTWRVTNFAVEIARKLGWNEEKLIEVERGGVLHDIGKIAVDNAILSKPGPLTDDEYNQMKVHPERGADLLREVKFLHPIIPYCLFHHERWDGTGYPYGLKGLDIPEEGRLIAVADAFDAMTSTRPYRESMNPEKALEIIEQGKNILFDPNMVDMLRACYKEGRIDKVLQNYYQKEAHSLACPFCGTFIRFDSNMNPGDEIQCHVCHKNICIIQKDGGFLGSLVSAVKEEHTPSKGDPSLLEDEY